jgi:hypothetical protein
LITGCNCFGASASPLIELYDPGTGTFGVTGGVSGLFGWWDNVNTATLLMNGNVLIAGNEENDGSSADVELYAPSAQIFSNLGKTPQPHEFATATLLPDGTVLIAGGQLPGGSGAAGADIYDSATGKFSAAGNMTVGRHSHTATLLPDGTVLIAGGYTGWPAPTSSAELYVPSVLTPALVVTDLRFDLAVVPAGTSYTTNISGSGLTSDTFFDVRFTSPGSNASAVVLNWQRGLTERHDVPVGLALGNWTINGVRPHQTETDHTGSFVPVSATITVSPGI